MRTVLKWSILTALLAIVPVINAGLGVAYAIAYCMGVIIAANIGDRSNPDDINEYTRRWNA